MFSRFFLAGEEIFGKWAQFSMRRDRAPCPHPMVLCCLVSFIYRAFFSGGVSLVARDLSSSDIREDTIKLKTVRGGGGGRREYNNQKETRGIIHRTFGHIYVSRDKGLFLLFLLVHGDKRLVGMADDCQLRFEDKRKSVPRSILLNLLRENFQPNLTVLGRLNVDKLCPPTTF